MNRRTKAYLLILTAVGIWGISGPVIKFTLEAIDPFPFLAYRLFISAIIGAILIFGLRPKTPKGFRNISQIIVFGLVGTVALSLLFLGINKSTVIELGLISAAGPLMVVAGGAVFLRERVSKSERKGIAIALLGVLMVVFIPFFRSEASVRISGNMILLLFLLCDSAYILLAKKLLKRKADPLTITSATYIVGAMAIIPFTLSEYGSTGLFEQILSMPLKYHIGVWYIAIMAGSLAHFLFMRGARTIEIGRASLFSYLSPVFSIPVAILWLKEILDPIYLIGAAVIVIGVYIAETKKH